MELPDIPIGDWGDTAFDWFRDVCAPVIEAFRVAIGWVANGVADGLLAVPFYILIPIFALIAFLVRSWQLAVMTLVTLALIVLMDIGLWESAMQTLSLVLVATLVSVIIGVPLGILAAKSNGFSSFIRPALDFLQTMPAFVWLIPAVLLFSIGYVPGIFATVLFAIAPSVRLTELGIRGVASDTVEAGQAFGATPGQILRGIQLPLAMPTIMAGINQVIMLSLSMAVLAGFVGAPGLGMDVVRAVSSQRLPLGIEAGLSIVIIAIFLDRVTSALGNLSQHQHSLLGLMRRARTPATASN